MEFLNVYQDGQRADAYSKLEFPGTYYLAYRDLPQIISEHVSGKCALDFGCGTGRSTRFLKKIGFNTAGIDISCEMVKKAKEMDPEGDYYVVEGEGLNQFNDKTYDLILSVFTFDNIPDLNKRSGWLKALRRLLKSEGRIILLDSTPEIYMNEWASFTTKDYPENKNAKSGDKVKIVMTDVDDRRPVEDIIWFNEDYMKMFEMTDVELVEVYKPLAKEDEPYEWVNETLIAPWIVYVLKIPE